MDGLYTPRRANRLKMHKAATRDKYSSARVSRDLDQYIVDPTTKKRYLRGRFLGKVRYTIGTNGHLKNPESTRANEPLIASK